MSSEKMKTSTRIVVIIMALAVATVCPLVILLVFKIGPAIFDIYHNIASWSYYLIWPDGHVDQLGGILDEFNIMGITLLYMLTSLLSLALMGVALAGKIPEEPTMESRKKNDGHN